jgi:hypothetical protein
LDSSLKEVRIEDLKKLRMYEFFYRALIIHNNKITQKMDKEQEIILVPKCQRQ